MRLSFTIDAWSAWSPRRTLASHWTTWAAGMVNTIKKSETVEPDVSMVPAIKRRRMSTLSKMAFATANNCNTIQQENPVCIFASRHGELTRTLSILQNITNKQDVSPTDFSMSVHNTAAGLYSIFSENHEPSTTIVGGDDTLNCALVEAWSYLNRFPDKPVLLVCFDEPVPHPFSGIDSQPGEAICLALLLRTGQSFTEKSFSLEYSCNESRKDLTTNPVESFLLFYLNDLASSVCITRRGQWLWTRH